jgi:hypothetical protein
MASDGPGAGDWTSPSPPGQQPPYFGAQNVGGQGSGGWSAPPPPPPPPGYGWGPQVPSAPRPGVIPLRPLGVGEILDGAFTTIRRYPAATLGLSGAVMLVVEVIRLLASYYFLHGVASDATTSANAGTVELVVGLATLVATSLLSGILAAIVGQAALGRPMSAGDAWRATRPVFWRLLGATVLISVIGIAIVFVGAIPGIVLLVAGVTGGGIALLVIGILAAAVFALYVTLSLTFTTPALMLEKQGILTSMRRSRTLVKGSWWRVFGVILLSGLIGLVVSGIVGAPFSLLGGGIGVFTSNGAPSQVTFSALLLTSIGALIGATLVRPFESGVIALLYLDRRMRAEALDLTLQRAAATPTP